jgi:hypothetical protein
LNPASTSFVLGYHGCDESLAARVIAGRSPLRPSGNDYDCPIPEISSPMFAKPAVNAWATIGASNKNECHDDNEKAVGINAGFLQGFFQQALPLDLKTHLTRGLRKLTTHQNQPIREMEPS